MKTQKTLLILSIALIGNCFVGYGQSKIHLLNSYKRALGHEERKSELKVIKGFVERTDELSLLIDAYALHGKWLFEIGEYATSKAYLDSAISVLNKYQPEKKGLYSSYHGSSLFDVYDHKANLFLELGNPTEARKWFQKSIAERQSKMNKGTPAQVTPF